MRIRDWSSDVCSSDLQSGRLAFSMAQVSPADIDVVEVYDAFTINTLLFLEDLGFCKKGEAGDFVSGGAIAPGGRLPVNTNGGEIGRASCRERVWQYV